MLCMAISQHMLAAAPALTGAPWQWVSKRFSLESLIAALKIYSGNLILPSFLGVIPLWISTSCPRLESSHQTSMTNLRVPNRIIRFFPHERSYFHWSDLSWEKSYDPNPRIRVIWFFLFPQYGGWQARQTKGWCGKNHMRCMSPYQVVCSHDLISLILLSFKWPSIYAPSLL